MSVIELITQIEAPIERVFDLSRSIDLHTRTASKTNETAVGGRTSGLIGLGETVTWNAVHFGVLLSHTSQITAYDRPVYFRDSMVAGVFSRLDHDHHFEKSKNGTLMRDLFDFNLPFWLIGKAVDMIFVGRYMSSFLKRRNQMIKKFAEGEEWQRFI